MVIGSGKEKTLMILIEQYCQESYIFHKGIIIGALILKK